MIIIGYFLALMTFVLSYYINDLIMNEDVKIIVYFGIFFNSFIVFRTVADFGFLVTNFRPQVLSRAVSIQKSGASIAAAITVPFFLSLNSSKFSEWFGYSEVILDHEKFCFILGLIILSSTMLIQYIVNEASDKKDE